MWCRVRSPSGFSLLVCLILRHAAGMQMTGARQSTSQSREPDSIQAAAVAAVTARRVAVAPIFLESSPVSFVSKMKGEIFANATGADASVASAAVQNAKHLADQFPGDLAIQGYLADIQHAADAQREALMPVVRQEVRATEAEKIIPLLFIGVNTGPANVARRNDVRKSWMKDMAVGSDGPVKARFIVGNPVGPDAAEVSAALAAEDAEHGDFLWLPVDDSYDGLTVKTFAFLTWFASEGPRSKYLMKLDDDTFPHFGPLVDMLRLQAIEETGGYSYMGFFHKCAAVHRDGKNNESVAVFGEPFFPTYASGSGYVLSGGLVNDLISVDSQPKLHNEDASVGVWVDKTSKTANFKAIPATLYGCSKGDALSMNLRPGEMRCMWNKLEAGSQNLCCDEKNDPWPEDAAARTASMLQEAAHQKIKCHPDAALLARKSLLMSNTTRANTTRRDQLIAEEALLATAAMTTAMRRGDDIKSDEGLEDFFRLGHIWQATP